MTNHKLDISAVYRNEAQRILDARQRAMAVHRTGDIPAAGSEVESSVRNAIAGRLPPRYRTTHGHILDYTGHVSSQLDVIIAENLASKSLFESSNGTEYVPYESVYAFGEIKSAYYKSKEPIQCFSEAIANARAKLRRQTSVHHQLLTFMVFCEANDFAASDVEAFFRDKPRDQLPTFVVFLDLGTIVFTTFSRNEHGLPLPVHYHLASSKELLPEANQRWSLIKWGEQDDRHGFNLMFLHLALIQHLLGCPTAAPNLTPYLQFHLTWDSGEIFK